MNKLILEIIAQEKSQKEIPIWLMRQAGRYLPEYRELRKSKKNFLEMCYDYNLASEITLQPIKRFNFDAAIIFSDILVIPDAMGINVKFEENHGPILEKIDNINSLKEALKRKNSKNLEEVYKAINITRDNLPKNTALIGFAGAAWTIAAYIVEGKLSKDLSKIKSIYYNDPKFIKALIDELINSISEHLINQIEAGAEIIQIFDSWAGTVTDEDYEELVIKPTQKIIKQVRKKYSNIPIICFPRMSGINYQKFCDMVDCNVISVDQFVSLNWVKKINNNKIIQGNLDPIVLLSQSQELIKKKVDIILNEMKENNFIFNLGHGVVPETPIENVEFLVNYIRSKRR